MFIFSTLFSFYFSFHMHFWSRNVRLRGVKSQTGVTKLLSTRCELSQGLPDSETSENSCCIQLNGCLSWYQVTCVAGAFRLSSSHGQGLLWKLAVSPFTWPVGRSLQTSCWKRAICFLSASFMQISIRPTWRFSHSTPLLIKHLFVFLSTELVPWAGIMVKNKLRHNSNHADWVLALSGIAS